MRKYMCGMSVLISVHREQRPCENGYPTYLGALHGNLRRYPSDLGYERFVCTEKRNHRKTLRNSQRESWIPIHPDVWKSPDGNESRAYVCMYEFEKVSKD